MTDDTKQPEAEAEAAVNSKVNGDHEAPAGAVEDSTTATPEADELTALKSQLEEAQAKAAEYLDGWQRARAEFANFKKRVEVERQEMRVRSKEDLLLKLLPIVDDFERAFQTVPEELKDVAWVNGMTMILQKLKSLLESEEVTPIEAEGQPFDPQIHEAMMQEETDQYPDGNVIAELQRGYRLRDRVLRPSMVKVASNPNSQPAPDEDADSQ